MERMSAVEGPHGIIILCLLLLLVFAFKQKRGALKRAHFLDCFILLDLFPPRFEDRISVF